jgi:hypothetical protein
VAHIGVEILLDGTFAEDAAVRESYARALSAGSSASLGVHIEWNDLQTRDRFEKLRGVLESRGVPKGGADPAAVAWRVARALSGRPRFRLDAEGERIVLSWAESASDEVGACAESVIAELRAGLRVTLPGTLGPRC